MYRVYDDNDNEFVNRKRESFDGDTAWEDDECYAIDNEGNRIENPNYTKEKSDKRKREIEIALIEGAGSDEAKQDLLAKQSDPSSEYYDYKKARESGYHPIVEQLDTLFWDMYNGKLGEEAKTSNFFLHRLANKESAPKP